MNVISMILFVYFLAVANHPKCKVDEVSLDSVTELNHLWLLPNDLRLLEIPGGISNGQKNWLFTNDTEEIVNIFMKEDLKFTVLTRTPKGFSIYALNLLDMTLSFLNHYQLVFTVGSVRVLSPLVDAIDEENGTVRLMSNHGIYRVATDHLHSGDFSLKLIGESQSDIKSRYVGFFLLDRKLNAARTESANLKVGLCPVMNGTDRYTIRCFVQKSSRVGHLVETNGVKTNNVQRIAIVANANGKRSIHLLEAINYVDEEIERIDAFKEGSLNHVVFSNKKGTFVTKASSKGFGEMCQLGPLLANYVISGFRAGQLEILFYDKNSIRKIRVKP